MDARAAAPQRDPARVTAPALLPVRRWPERRVVVLSVAAALFAAIFALRETTADAVVATGLLFVVPVALAALELGLVGGIAAAALALGLVAVWAHGSEVDLGAVGYATRGVAFLAVGGIVGRFSDRMRQAARRQGRLLESGLTLAHLPGNGDLPRTVVRRARAALGAAGARVELVDGRAVDDGTVGESPLRVPLEVGATRFGTLAIEPLRQLEPEDHEALAMIALQASVACENEALLASERERAALEHELGETRHRLRERGDQLREVLADQESERRHVAYRLHEGTAQALAAILLGLGSLERELDSEAATPHLDTLRSHVDATLVDLRNLAVSLRPPVLDLGLEVALRGLGEQLRERGLERMDVGLGDSEVRLSREESTTIYRVVEEMLDAFDAPVTAAVRAQERELRIVVRGRDGESPRPDRLATIGARAELLGGRLEGEDAMLQLRIPLATAETLAPVKDAR